MMKTQNYIKVLEKEIQAREVKLKAIGLNPFMTREEKIVKAKSLTKDIRDLEREVADLCRRAQVFVFVKKKFYGNFWKIKN